MENQRKKNLKSFKIARYIEISKPKKNVDVGFSVLPDPKYFVIRKSFVAAKGSEIQCTYLNKKEAAKIWPLMQKWARSKKHA